MRECACLRILKLSYIYFIIGADLAIWRAGTGPRLLWSPKMSEFLSHHQQQPSWQELLRFPDASGSLKQLQELLEGSCRRDEGLLELAEAQFDFTNVLEDDKFFTLQQSEVKEEELDEFVRDDDEEEERVCLPTPGLSLVEQLQMDQPLMDVIAHKHKRGCHRCTHCPMTFSSIFDYAAHMDEYGIKREFKCPVALCPWKILGLPRRPDLRRHCAIQHKHELPDELKEYLNLSDETYPALSCPYQYCDKVFHRRDAYNRHISIVHEKTGSRFNKRLTQILAHCPYDKETERKKYVTAKMRTRKVSCHGRGLGH